MPELRAQDAPRTGPTLQSEYLPQVRNDDDQRLMADKNLATTRRFKMPGGDGTGPAGMGPMTGRAAGYCVGYAMPGSVNPVAGRGFGDCLLLKKGTTDENCNHSYRSEPGSQCGSAFWAVCMLPCRGNRRSELRGRREPECCVGRRRGHSVRPTCRIQRRHARTDGQLRSQCPPDALGCRYRHRRRLLGGGSRRYRAVQGRAVRRHRRAQCRQPLRYERNGP